YNIACKIRKISKKYNSLLIINDRIDIALAVEADGIHVGKNSLPISAIKKLMSQHNHKLLIGYSTHSLKEAKELESEGVDWITFSPIYQSQSKSKYLSPKGLSSLEELVKNISIPVYALGGIKQTNIKDVMCTGVYGVALISEIISSNNPKQTANNLLSILDKDIK
ncbi:MAG: thiamine phosphate synthase, partial [Spirochaetota bacterium]|nr:thiamine phosphate synthase [Spirochaetota bacterium]